MTIDRHYCRRLVVDAARLMLFAAALLVLGLVLWPVAWMREE